MWLDPEGPTTEPFPKGPRYRSYKYTGRSIAREGQFGDKTFFWFRAGCANQKDISNHNGFVWYPAGRRVIDTPRSNLDAWRDDAVNYFKDWQNFFGTSRASNVILVDGKGQRSTDPILWPGQADREWLHRRTAVPTSKIVSETMLNDGVRWVGEAQRAYPGQIQLWRRNVELRDWLNLEIDDEIRTAKADARIDWLLHSPGMWKKIGDLYEVEYEGVRVAVEFHSPADLSISTQQTPAGQGGRHTSYLQATTSAVKSSASIRASMRATILKT
jgi:hypothetical protein